MGGDGAGAWVPPRYARSRMKGRRWVRWSIKKKELFLDHLAATCNVKQSAAVAGVDPVSVYALRRRDAAFVAAWGEALALGYEMIETQLVGHALEGSGARAITNGAVEKTGPIDVELALRLLSHHGAAMAGRVPRGGPKRQRASREETEAAILKRLAAIAGAAPDQPG